MKIYCDASYKKGIAGIGIFVKDGVKERVLSVYIPAVDNNYGELWACYLSAIISGGRETTIYTDSQTALDYIQGRRGKEYEDKHKQEWTLEQYTKHKSMQLLSYKVRRVSPNIKFDKIKGHLNKYQTHQLGNTQADLLAKRGIAKYLERVNERK